MPTSRNYTRRRVLTIAIVTAASPAGILSLNAGVPADRRVVAQSRFDVTSAPLQAEVVQLLVDFPPGAWSSWHTHGGQATNLVLEGEITLRHAGMEHPYRVGQAWTDSSGQVHAAVQGGGGLVGARWHLGFRGEQVGQHGPRLHDQFAAESNWPVTRLADSGDQVPQGSFAMDRIIAASWSAELKLAVAILIGIALATGIAVFLKYLIEL